MDEYEVQVKLTDKDGETVTITVPNADENLTSDSSTVNDLLAAIVDGTGNSEKLFRINNNGQNEVPARADITLIRKTTTELGWRSPTTPT